MVDTFASDRSDQSLLAGAGGFELPNPDTRAPIRAPQPWRITLMPWASKTIIEANREFVALAQSPHRNIRALAVCLSCARHCRGHCRRPPAPLSDGQTAVARDSARLVRPMHRIPIQPLKLCSNPNRICRLNLRYCSPLNSAMDWGGRPEKIPSLTSVSRADSGRIHL